MANCMLCYPNVSDTAALSGGDWQSGAPVTNVTTKEMQQYARTSDVSPLSSVIEFDFDNLTACSVLALANHNISLSGKARVVLWKDHERTIVAYDSGFVPVWPRWKPTLQLRWSDHNFWGGQAPEAVRTTFPSLFLKVFSKGGKFPAAISARAATCYISDSKNTDGYVEIGRVFLGPDWTPFINMEFGAQVAWVDPSVVNRVMNGAKVFEKRPKYRQAVFSLKTMEPDEGVSEALLLTGLLGITEQLLYVFDPEDDTKIQQTSFIGTLSDISPLVWWQYNLTSMGWKVEEAR